MALADYYSRSALAAAQVLAGFDEERIRAVLESARIGIAIGSDAAQTPEGKATIDLLVRLLARLYPTLTVRFQTGAESVADDAVSLARRINPNVAIADEPTVEIAVGEELPSAGVWKRIYVGSNGWNAFVGALPKAIGGSDNPFGAGVAACLGAANLFRFIFHADEASLDSDATFSALDMESRPSSKSGAFGGSLGELVMVGAGAIGNAAAWAFSRVPMKGILHIVDHQTVDLGNLQRYSLLEREDETRLKVEALGRHFNAKLRAEIYAQDFASFVESHGYLWPRIILALDSARDRRAAQSSLPEWIANAWTQPGDLGVSSHDFLNGACVSCLYLPDHALENEDAIIASALGVPDRLMQIRILLATGRGVPRDLLDAISVARTIPIERLLPFADAPVRTLYVEGFCGGAVIPLGAAGLPRQEVHVPLAHQSALAGVLLAAMSIRRALGIIGPGTHVTRINLMRPLGSNLTQPAAKDSRGICICQDADYRNIYEQKYFKGGEQHGELHHESGATRGDLR